MLMPVGGRSYLDKADSMEGIWSRRSRCHTEAEPDI